MSVYTLLVIRSMNEVKKNLLEWAEYVGIKRPEIGNWPICPFAKLTKSLEIIIDDIANIENHIETARANEVTILTKGDSSPPFDDLDYICRSLNKKYTDLIFLPDHPDCHNFIQNLETGNQKYAVVIIQSKEKLLKSRKALENTDYYSYWSEIYKEEIFSYGNEK